jgi:hypothetical protein
MTVTVKRAERVLAEVAAWMGRKGYGTATCPQGRALNRILCHADDGTECSFEVGPAPTGPDAAYRGEGPMLKMDYEGWYGPTRPAILLEGGPYDWAVDCCGDVQDALDKAKVPVFVEPIAGYALGIYPA